MILNQIQLQFAADELRFVAKMRFYKLISTDPLLMYKLHPLIKQAYTSKNNYKREQLP